MLLSTCSATQMCCVPEASCTFATLSRARRKHDRSYNHTAISCNNTNPSHIAFISSHHYSLLILHFLCSLVSFFIRHVPAALVFLHVALFPPAVSFSTSDLSASACLPCPASVPLYATLPHPKFYLPRCSDLHSVVPHEAIRCL